MRLGSKVGSGVVLLFLFLFFPPVPFHAKSAIAPSVGILMCGSGPPAPFRENLVVSARFFMRYPIKRPCYGVNLSCFAVRDLVFLPSGHFLAPCCSFAGVIWCCYFARAINFFVGCFLHRPEFSSCCWVFSKLYGAKRYEARR